MCDMDMFSMLQEGFDCNTEFQEHILGTGDSLELRVFNFDTQAILEGGLSMESQGIFLIYFIL